MNLLNSAVSMNSLISPGSMIPLKLMKPTKAMKQTFAPPGVVGEIVQPERREFSGAPGVPLAPRSVVPHLPAGEYGPGLT